jgi:hypothetical protein
LLPLASIDPFTIPPNKGADFFLATLLGSQQVLELKIYKSIFNNT